MAGVRTPPFSRSSFVGNVAYGNPIGLFDFFYLVDEGFFDVWGVFLSSVFEALFGTIYGVHCDRWFMLSPGAAAAIIAEG
ncbi:hypothetical protein C1H46_010410 [Malus baccata]|uniref:Uncharacterized protein n=1 Tax=Malus baccata TaxID=106549 RepID=A0A540MZ60_MALBA|nr:hypothetical protein C1H46_010410 [Malus baccata]